MPGTPVALFQILDQGVAPGRFYNSFAERREAWTCPESVLRPTVQPRVLFPRLLHLSNLIYVQPNILGPPSTEGLFADTRLPNQLCNRYSYLSLLESQFDLLYGKLLLQGKIPSPFFGLAFVEVLTFQIAQF
jgi:hypothetical protein